MQQAHVRKVAQHALQRVRLRRRPRVGEGEQPRHLRAEAPVHLRLHRAEDRRLRARGLVLPGKRARAHEDALRVAKGRGLDRRKRLRAVHKGDRALFREQLDGLFLRLHRRREGQRPRLAEVLAVRPAGHARLALLPVKGEGDRLLAGKVPDLGPRARELHADRLGLARDLQRRIVLPEHAHTAQRPQTDLCAALLLQRRLRVQHRGQQVRHRRPQGPAQDLLPRAQQARRLARGRKARREDLLPLRVRALRVRLLQARLVKGPGRVVRARPLPGDERLPGRAQLLRGLGHLAEPAQQLRPQRHHALALAEDAAQPSHRALGRGVEPGQRVEHRDPAVRRLRQEGGQVLPRVLARKAPQVGQHRLVALLAPRIAQGRALEQQVLRALRVAVARRLLRPQQQVAAQRVLLAAPGAQVCRAVGVQGRRRLIRGRAVRLARRFRRLRGLRARIGFPRRGRVLLRFRVRAALLRPGDAPGRELARGQALDGEGDQRLLDVQGRARVQEVEQAQLHDVAGAEVEALAVLRAQAAKELVRIVEHQRARAHALLHGRAVGKGHARLGIVVVCAGGFPGAGGIPGAGCFPGTGRALSARKVRRRERAILHQRRDLANPAVARPLFVRGHGEGDLDAAGVLRAQDLLPERAAGDVLPPEEELDVPLLRLAVSIDLVIVHNLAKALARELFPHVAGAEFLLRLAQGDLFRHAMAVLHAHRRLRRERPSRPAAKAFGKRFVRDLRSNEQRLAAAVERQAPHARGRVIPVDPSLRVHRGLLRRVRRLLRLRLVHFLCRRRLLPHGFPLRRALLPPHAARQGKRRNARKRDGALQILLAEQQPILGNVQHAPAHLAPADEGDIHLFPHAHLFSPRRFHNSHTKNPPSKSRATQRSGILFPL